MTEPMPGIFAPVLPGIADADHAAVRRAQAARALDLEEEEFDAVGRPGDFQPAPRQRAILDLGRGRSNGRMCRSGHSGQAARARCVRPAEYRRASRARDRKGGRRSARRSPAGASALRRFPARNIRWQKPCRHRRQPFRNAPRKSPRRHWTSAEVAALHAACQSAGRVSPLASSRWSRRGQLSAKEARAAPASSCLSWSEPIAGPAPDSGRAGR